MIKRMVGEDARNMDNGTGVNTKGVSKDMKSEKMELHAEEKADAKRCDESAGEHVDTQNLLKRDE